MEAEGGDLVESCSDEVLNGVMVVRVEGKIFPPVCGASVMVVMLLVLKSSTKAGGADLVSTYPLEDAKTHLSMSADCCERTRIL